MRPPHPVSGFTLIELMVTLSIMAVVVALVAPGFNDTIARTRVKSQASDVVNMLELARSASLKRTAVTTTLTIGSSGATWRVSTEWQHPDASAESRSITQAGGVTMVAPSLAGSTSTTADFRGVFSGFVSTNGCKDGDTCMQLRSAGGKYQVRVGINAVGQVAACAVGDSFGGYPKC